jgi:hypothetical protein
MPSRTEYQVISGQTPAQFATELERATALGWKPILLTSASPNATIPQGAVVVVAIMEKQS